MAHESPARTLSTELRAATMRLARRLRREKADDELSDGQAGVLAVVLRDGPMTPVALSALEHVTPPSMNRTLNALENAGYVVRVRSDDDRRLVLVTLTDAGRQVVLETRRRRDAWLDRRLASLSAEELDLLDRAAVVIRRMVDE
ncbi:MarR family winged helix-turn-helix transcriptional regulator [Herbiconiux ginsengi]|uniref:DNA-binding transcriptional regulator, MarR family n=1 Tax=Herbiconiux ginsengi TaxID=381665 RepID=A0A1H3RRC6_9MICO|nr:MarR family transcriptional regulator [Herbiconiux ginsengi]SDZ28160.1 DNA-binding transcriptional regulator, MarR family [Herbiconiux ginsengi]